MTTAVATDGRLGFTTQENELALDDVPVAGSFPDWLTGTLVRTGPAKFEAGERSVNHWFDGLAMLHGFSFSDGRVSYANRFLRSKQYEAVERDGELSYLEFASDPCRSLFRRVQALWKQGITDNGAVNVTRLGDEYLALTESPLPVVFDPQTLETIGRPDWAPRAVPGIHASAHPHHDRARNELVSYAIHLGAMSSYRLYTQAAGGRSRIVGKVAAREPAYMHSFALTERYAVLIDQPFCVNPARIAFSGKPFIENYRWRPERGTSFLVLDRATGELVARCEGPPLFVFHTVNAWEDGGEIVLDMCSYEDASIVDSLYLERLRAEDWTTASPPVLKRYRLPLDGGAVREEQLVEIPFELPRIDYARRNGRPYRYAYGTSGTGAGPHFDVIAKVDTDDGSWSGWSEPGCFPGEPVFVREPGSEREDAGVCLSVVLDAERGRSFLLAVDAGSWEELGRAEVPQHIPFGFHGQWIPPRASLPAS